MKTHVLSISLLLCLATSAQSQDSLNFRFEEPELKVKAFTILPIVYIGSCLCHVDDGSMPVIDSLAKFLLTHDSIKVHIEDHTDSMGPDQMNLKISDYRSNDVVRALIKRGVSEKQMTAIPLGESEPWIVTDENAKQYPFLESGTSLNDEVVAKLSKDQIAICHSLNRRTVLRIIDIGV